MNAAGRGWRIFWGAVTALATGAWLVGIGGFGMAVSHSGLVRPQDWIDDAWLLAGGAAVASSAAAMLLRAFRHDPARSLVAAAAWGALTMLGAFAMALVVSMWSEAPAAVPAIALPACALPAVALVRAVARARRDRRGPAPLPRA